MKWIVDIINVEPYKVTCMWNDKKVRTIDLEDFIKLHSENPKNSYYQLLDKKRFAGVKCDGTTLYWENGIFYTDIDGKVRKGPLDIAPEVLYEECLIVESAIN